MAASVEELVVEVVDAEMYMLGGEVTRRSLVDVMTGLETVNEAADAVAREARRTVREQRKAELHAGVGRACGEAEEKLHVS